jgi:murein DD-endopeptidase MepM/ murein hydrolase activator NlpD
MAIAALAAPAHAETAPAAAPVAGAVSETDQAFAAWITAAERVRGAGQALGAWVDGLQADAAEVTERATAYFHVQLRHALAASEKWLSSMITDLEAHSRFVVPDLTVLVAEPVKGIESSGFGWRLDPINDRKKFHKGTDYRADRGTPVYAAGAGVVVFTGRQKGYGKVIYLDHGGGLVTRYAHLREIGVEAGDTVAGDALIGEVGSTGRTTGPHLHFEVRIDGRAVDPKLAMDIGRLQRSEAPEVVRIAALALLPEVQRESVDAHDPPPDRGRKNRPERSGRRGSRRDRPTS